MTTKVDVTPTSVGPEILGIWINRFLEGLWLLALGLVPLAYLSPDYILSEAAIGYVEVPKVTLLRVLVGIMAVLWAFEWALRGQDSPISLDRIKEFRIQPASWSSSFRAWLSFRETRLLVLAVWFFFGTTLLSTLLSGSFKVSLWGDIPGQDGYSFYNVSSYLLLFAVINTHLKSRGQLWRLLGVVVAMGTIIGGYAVLQRSGHDFLGLSDQTGGFITAFAGNTIFAAAVLLMTITVSVGVGAVTLREPSIQTFIGLRRTARQWAPVILLAWAWCFVISTQMLGIIHTTSRGPWLGTMVALAVLFILAAWAGGWNYFTKIAALIGFPAAITLAIVQFDISMYHPGLWLAATIAIVVFFASVPVIGWRNLGRITLIGAVAAGIFVAVVVGPDLGKTTGDDSSAVSSGEQFGTVGSRVISGVLGDRLTHWDVSWELIRFHPWFGFDDLSLPWLRQLIGYGPDLFRSTYLLRSPPDGPGDRPLEPDHAHNFIIHQTVEQGYLGFFSSVGLFAASFFIGARLVLRRSQELSPTHRLILALLLAIMAGRLAEMMVGVARVSDLTVLWGLIALLAALASFVKDAGSPEITSGRPEPSRRAKRRKSRPKTGAGFFDFMGQSLWRFAVVAILVGVFGTLAWSKNINYVRAGIAAQDAAEQFRAGEWEGVVESFDKAIRLAPDVPSYHNNRSEVFRAFFIAGERFSEPNCATQDELSYGLCLVIQSHQSNLNATVQRPLYYRSRLAVANSAFNLQLYDEAIVSYQDALTMVPNSKSITSALAEAYLEDGQTELAIEQLKKSITIGPSIEGYLLLGIAQMKVGDSVNAIESLTKGLAEGLPRIADRAHLALAQAYIAQGADIWELTTPRAAITLLSPSLKLDITAELEIEIRKILGAAYEGVDEPATGASNYLIVATLYWAQGSGAKAKDSLERSLELTPTVEHRREAQALLAEIAEAEGDFEAAALYRELSKK